MYMRKHGLNVNKLIDLLNSRDIKQKLSSDE